MALAANCLQDTWPRPKNSAWVTLQAFIRRRAERGRAWWGPTSSGDALCAELWVSSHPSFEVMPQSRAVGRLEQRMDAGKAVTLKPPVPLSPGGDSRRAPWQGTTEPWRAWEVGQRGQADAVTEAEGSCFPEQVSLLRVPLVWSR